MEAAAEKSQSATVLDLQARTYYNLYHTTNWWNLLSDLHAPHEQWVLDRHFWCLFCLLLTGIHHLAHVPTVPPTKAHLLCASAVPWISEDRLLHISELFSYYYVNPFLSLIDKIHPCINLKWNIHVYTKIKHKFLKTYSPPCCPC